MLLLNSAAVVVASFYHINVVVVAFRAVGFSCVVVGAKLSRKL